MRRFKPLTKVQPRVLLVTRNLPPLVGGMERLNWHMAEELAKMADVRIVGPQGSAGQAPAGVAVREVPLRPLWKFLLAARALARREARQWRPDIVLAGSGLTAPLARSAARTCGARSAVYVHGLDVAAKHPVYRAVWLPALRRMDQVIANSHATALMCQAIGIGTARVDVLHPGVDLPRDGCRHLHPSRSPAAAGSVPVAYADGAATAFRQRHNLGNRPLLLSVGRLSTRKGLREFVTQCLPAIVAAHPEVMLLVVGDAPMDALHAHAQTPDSIRAAAERAGVGGHLLFLGTITDYAQLGSVYRAANVHVFPVREIPGDPEGFGMVAVEAAAHGLPTVAFATGGVPDAVVEGVTGSLIPSGDYAAFAAEVSKWLSRDDRAVSTAACVAAAERFSWLHFGDRLQAILHLDG